MKTEQSKQLMQRALRELPQDFALREVRRNLARAITELNRVEDKRERRSRELTPHERWTLDLQTSSLVAPRLTPEQQQNVLGQIDAMIAAENAKIKQMEEEGEENLLVD
jgi:hypothetical protein